MKEKRLLTKWYIHPEAIEQVIESLADHLGDDEELPAYEKWWYTTDAFSLQEILDLSKDFDPKDVIISIYRDRQVQDITVSVNHRIKDE